MLDKTQMDGSAENPVFILRAQLWCTLIHAAIVNYCKSRGLHHSDQIHSRLEIEWGRSNRVLTSSSDKEHSFNIYISMSGLEWIFCISESNLFLTFSNKPSLDVSETSIARKNHGQKCNEQVSDDSNIIMPGKDTQFKGIKTSDLASGCCDLALAFTASDLLCLYQVYYNHKASKVDVLGIKPTNQDHSGSLSLSGKKKRCIILLSPETIGDVPDRFCTFLEKVSEYYEVIFIPPSVNIRSEAYRKYIMLSNHLDSRISLSSYCPCLSDLFSLSDPDKTLFISDVSMAGWMFTALGFNTVYLSNFRSEELCHLRDGYCQRLGIEMNEDKTLLQSLQRIESSKQYKGQQLEICKLYSRNIFCELISMIDS